MRLSDLDKHEIIAWDMDGTLVEGKYSHLLRNYIRTNPNKKHHIITFRTGKSRLASSNSSSWVEDCYIELGTYDLDKSHFSGIHGIPSELFDRFAKLGHSTEFLEWKAKKAFELGATVLVDDMKEWVIKGCLRYGVEFINSK